MCTQVSTPAHADCGKYGNGITINPTLGNESGDEAEGSTYGTQCGDGEGDEVWVFEAEEPTEEESDFLTYPGKELYTLVGGAGIFAIGRGTEGEYHYQCRDDEHTGDNGEAYGLMQIQKKWHKKRMQKVNAVNLLNCYDNIHVGVDYLAELYKANNKNWHKALMAYNGGQAYANRRVKNGIYSSEYSRNVMERAYKYKTERND